MTPAKKPPMKFTYEVKVVGGEVGKLIARQQAKALLDILQWIRDHREGDARVCSSTDSTDTSSTSHTPTPDSTRG